jgi:hypothetical protein
MTETWVRFSHLTLDDIDSQLFDYGMNFAFGKKGSSHRKILTDRIGALQSTDFNPTRLQIGVIANEILMDIADRLRQKLFTNLLRQQSIPEAAILRLYPPGPKPGTFAFLEKVLDEGFLFPNTPERGAKRAQVIPLRDPP